MDFDSLRKRMVDEQLIPRGISNPRVISAFLKVPRHEFIPEESRDAAYGDHPLPIGGGQTISQPYMVALMTECMALEGHEKVLEIGAGSGYQAAIMAELTTEIFTIERVAFISRHCRETLDRLGYTAVKVVTGDGSLGYKEQSPYDAIMVTCAAPSLPAQYTGQLKPNGRIVIPVGSRFSQILAVVQKTGNGIDTQKVCGCRFVPLIGEDGWEG